MDLGLAGIIEPQKRKGPDPKDQPFQLSSERRRHRWLAMLRER
jgi:hypothetical protein